MTWAVILLVGLFMAGCGGSWIGDQNGGLVLIARQRKAAERFLNTQLPSGAQDIHFYLHQHGGKLGDVDKYSAYLKFRSSRSDYLEFMQRLRVNVYPGSSPELRLWLPGHWKLAPGLRLTWWDASLDIPDDTGLSPFGMNGFIVAKRERGFVYLQASDHGSPES